MSYLFVVFGPGRAVNSSYAATTSFAGPSIRSVPASSHSARSQVSVIVEFEWLTRKTVPASARSSSIRRWLRRRKRASRSTGPRR